MRFVLETLLSRSRGFEAAMFVVPMLVSSLGKFGLAVVTEIVPSAIRFAQAL